MGNKHTNRTTSYINSNNKKESSLLIHHNRNLLLKNLFNRILEIHFRNDSKYVLIDLNLKMLFVYVSKCTY